MASSFPAVETFFLAKEAFLEFDKNNTGSIETTVCAAGFQVLMARLFYQVFIGHFLFTIFVQLRRVSPVTSIFASSKVLNYLKLIIKELISVLRSLGHNPTDNEVQDMINQVDVEGTGQIDFNELAKFLVKLNNNQGDAEEETMQLFRRLELLSDHVFNL